MTNDRSPVTNDHSPCLGIARDEAFQFYYEDNLDLLRQHGVELVPFSPLHDRALPPDLAGLYIGGGDPELHGERLSGNRVMRDAIRVFAGTGKPVYAECGGLMYLCEALHDQGGREWTMCGVLPARTRMENSLRRLGYVEVETLHHGLFGAKGTHIRGHEFHWSDIVMAPSDSKPLFAVRYVRDDTPATTGLRRGNVWASYLHLHFGSNPAAAEAWASALTTRTAHSSSHGRISS